VRYDLLLQSLVPGTPFDSDRVEALLEARGAKQLPGGGRVWLLEEGSVELHPLRENGQWIATEVRVPLLDQTELVREVVRRVGELAKEAEVRFFDPQLGQELSPRSEGVVVDQYQRTARYAAEMGGVASAMPIDRGEDSGFQPTTKMGFAVMGFFALLYFVMRWINGQLHGQ
jgi:hypothetical protein